MNTRKSKLKIVTQNDGELTPQFEQRLQKEVTEIQNKMGDDYEMVICMPTITSNDRLIMLLQWNEYEPEVEQR